MNGVHVGHFADLGEVGFARQREHLGNHRRIQRLVLQQTAHCLDQTLVQRQCFTALMLADQLLQHLHRQLLTRFPAIEAIGVVLHEEHQLVATVRIVQLHRCGEAAQQRRLRTLGHVDEGEALLGLGDRQYAAGALGLRLTLQAQRQVAAIGSQQAQLHGNHEWLLGRLARRRRAALAERQAVGLRHLVVLLADRQTRGAGLAVPALELRQIGAVGIFHRLDEIIDGHGLAVVALEIEVAALAEAFLAEQRLDHAHHFGTLFIDSQGVEVGDLDE